MQSLSLSLIVMLSHSCSDRRGRVVTGRRVQTSVCPVAHARYLARSTKTTFSFDYLWKSKFQVAGHHSVLFTTKMLASETNVRNARPWPKKKGVVQQLWSFAFWQLPFL